jgi:peptidoglycan/LPS O-acetylase OafA/YrhL
MRYDREGGLDRWAFAHLLRGIAALSVIVFHTTWVFWQWPGAVAGLLYVPAAPGERLGLWPGAFARMPWFNLGSFGVALFFLISGFVIPYALMRQSRLGFLVARVLRLWPTYAVGLASTIVWLGLLAWVFGRPFPLRWTDVARHFALGARDLTSTPSIDGVVWTLEVEVRFYLMCLLMAPAFRRGRAWAVAGPLAGLAAVVVIADRWGGLVDSHGLTWARARGVIGLDGAMIAFMLVGAACHLGVRGTTGKRAAKALATVSFGVFLWLVSLDPAAGAFTPTAMSYGAAVIVFVAALAARDRIASHGVLSALADISYPLYVLHAVPGYVIMRLALSRGFGPWACVAMAWAWALAAAAIVHVWIERPTHAWARAVAARWTRDYRTDAWLHATRQVSEVASPAGTSRTSSPSRSMASGSPERNT